VWNRRPSKLKTVDDKKRVGKPKIRPAFRVPLVALYGCAMRSKQVLFLLAVTGETSVTNKGWSIMSPVYPQPQCYEYVAI
jgi:hypothetical protein